jgi:uncharacterized protein
MCWQTAAMNGAEHMNAPGGFCWNELQTRDIDAAKPFYAAAFGWSAETRGDPPMAYTEWQLGGRSVAGGMNIPPNAPPNMPPHWLVYFAVDDVDAATGKVQELGGSVIAPPMDSPAGRFAVVADPHGAAFAVIKLQPR